MKFINEYISEIKLKNGFLNNNVIEYDIHINQRKVTDWKGVKYKSKNKGIKVVRNYNTINYELAFIFQNKKGFNTYLFKKNYDVIITDRFGQIIDIFENLDNNFMSEYYKNAYYISFFPIGTVKMLEIKIEDRLQFIKPTNRVTLFDVV